MNDQSKSAQPFRLNSNILVGFPAIRMVLKVDFDTLELLDEAREESIGNGRVR